MVLALSSCNNCKDIVKHVHNKICEYLCRVWYCISLLDIKIQCIIFPAFIANSNHIMQIGFWYSNIDWKCQCALKHTIDKH